MQPDSFILIGGRSSRMGTDKATVPLDGSPMLARVVANVRAALPGSRISLAASEPSQLLGVAGLNLDLPFVLDVYEGRGAVGGLHAGLANAGTEWIFAIACDLPLAAPELIRCLADSITAAAGAVVPVQPDGRLQPLCAFYRVRPMLGVVEKALSSPRTTPPLRLLLDDVNTIRVLPADMPCGADHFFHNVNTPRELENAARVLNGDGTPVSGD